MIFDVRKWLNMAGMSDVSECPSGYNHQPIKCNFYFHIFRRIFYNVFKQIYNIDTIHIPRNNKKQFNLTVKGDHGTKLTINANRDIIYREV